MKPLFKTTNGKEIFEGDKYYFKEGNDWMEATASRKWLLPTVETYSEIPPVQVEGESQILSGNKKIDEYIGQLEKANLIWQDEIRSKNEKYNKLSEHCDGVERENEELKRIFGIHTDYILKLDRELNILKWYSYIVSLLLIVYIISIYGLN